MTTDAPQPSGRQHVGQWIVWLGGGLLLVQIIAAVLWWKLPAWAPEWVVTHSPWPDPAIRASAHDDKLYDRLEDRRAEWDGDWWRCLSRHFRAATGPRRTELMIVACLVFYRQNNDQSAYVGLAVYEQRDAAVLEMALGAVEDPELLSKSGASHSHDLGGWGLSLLSILKSPRAVPPLCRLLESRAMVDQSDSIIEALAHQGDRQVAPLLIRWLPVPEAGGTAYALRKLLPPGAPEAVAVLGDPDPVIRAWALEQVSDMKQAPAADAQVMAGVLPLLHDRERDIRLQAISTLGRWRSAAARPVLEGFLGDGDALVRAWSVEALGLIGDPASVAALVPLLGDADSNTRRFTIIALGRLRDARAVPMLLPVLADDDDDIAGAAWSALGGLPLSADQRQRARLVWSAREQR